MFQALGGLYEIRHVHLPQCVSIATEGLTRECGEEENVPAKNVHGHQWAGTRVGAPGA